MNKKTKGIMILVLGIIGLIMAFILINESRVDLGGGIIRHTGSDFEQFGMIALAIASICAIIAGISILRNNRD